MVDGITPHKSPLFKRGRNVVAEVVTLSFSNKGEMDESVIRDKVMAGSGSKSFVK